LTICCDSVHSLASFPLSLMITYHRCLPICALPK